MILSTVSISCDENDLPDSGTPYLVTFIDELVSSRNQLQAVYMIKFGGDLVTKKPAGASWADGPCFDILGVRPDQVAKRSFVGDLLGTGNNANLVNRSNFRAQTTVDT